MQGAPARHFRECGYTPYACCGISTLTTTTVDAPHFAKGKRTFSRKNAPRKMRDAPLSVKLCIAAIARLFFLPVDHLRGGVAALDAQLAVDTFGVIFYGIL